MSITTRTEWGIRFGDGQVQLAEPSWTYQNAVRMRGDIRSQIAAGEVDAGDYEPMTLVRRRVQVTTDITPWEDSPR